MTKLKTRVVRLRTPDPVADHYFKLSDRLQRFCGVKLTLDVADFDWVDNCLCIAMLEYELATTENDTGAIAKDLKCISRELGKIARLLSHRPINDVIGRSAQEDIAFLLNEQMGFPSTRDFSEFTNQIDIFRKACDAAVAKLRTSEAKKGRKHLYWYDAFIFGMQVAANKSGISMSVQCRDQVKLRTPFLDLVGAYEMCLPREMRSSSRAARAKRIETSLRRLAAGETDLITQ